ncbi:helix-turn-helix domain-containing protein [Clostridium sporogenes]|uniref:helix-turn-helix domain-containing protein n=1 Tax=Clostridium sporogenes TaxID=1509 RepID=UPI0005EFDB21|nr:helix-turn-helix domain-containing protein [Clostridium sporogenes]MBY7015151.1 helix-turn-helix domain-containing protein [Clostridium sporogenes]UAL65084.1 helix-turn-helix domain-containing protein [Clostridium sporogenes]
MNENWYTLAIAIFYKRPCTMEQAIELYNNGKLARNKRPKEDIEDMIKLRQQGLKFKEIAEIFCLTPSTVRNFVSSFKKKKIAPCQEPNN